MCSASVWHAERSDSGLCYQITLENHVLLVAVRRQNQWQQLGQYSQNAKKKWHSRQLHAFTEAQRLANQTGQFQTSGALEIPSSSPRLWRVAWWSQMRENFPFNQTSKGKAAKGKSLIITKQNSHSSANDFLASGPCFCKRGCCSSDERRGPERKQGSAFSKLDCRVSMCPHWLKVWRQKVKNAPYLNRPWSHVTFTHNPCCFCRVHHFLGENVEGEVTLRITSPDHYWTVGYKRDWVKTFRGRNYDLQLVGFTNKSFFWCKSSILHWITT